MYEACKRSSGTEQNRSMLRVHAPELPELFRRLAVISVHMAKRSKDPASTSSEPAAKRQRMFTNAAGPSGDVKMGQAAPNNRIPHEEFAALRQRMEHSDAQRETIIKKSRDVQKYSKQAIFAAHRSDAERCSKLLSDAAAVAADILPILTELPSLRYGSFSNAMEEVKDHATASLLQYAEAKCFELFLKEGRVIAPSELENVERDEYLGGVLDFTGELNRYAVAKATRRDTEAVAKCRDVVEGLMGEFLQFDLRNGSIRKKYDSLKYTLRKLENTLYELSLAEAGYKRHEDADREPNEEQDKGEQPDNE